MDNTNNDMITISRKILEDAVMLSSIVLTVSCPHLAVLFLITSFIQSTTTIKFRPSLSTRPIKRNISILGGRLTDIVESCSVQG